jgi:hypothetical protein
MKDPTSTSASLVFQSEMRVSGYSEFWAHSMGADTTT